jgi:hypothetical protein
VIVDQGEEAEEKMQAALAEHAARYPEDAGLTVADFDWITRVVLRADEVLWNVAPSGGDGSHADPPGGDGVSDAFDFTD